MNIKLIISLICLAIGIYLIFDANKSKDTTGQRIKREFTGTYSDNVRNNMIGGVILVAVGGALLFLSFRRSS